MRLIAPVFVEELFDGRAGPACSQALAQCRQPGKPRPAVCGRSRLGQPGEFGDRMSVAVNHDFLAALGQGDQPEQFGLSLFQCRRHAVI